MPKKTVTAPEFSGAVDLSQWDETIFERCLQAGFNPFGCGPTPVFLRHKFLDEAVENHLPGEPLGANGHG